MKVGISLTSNHPDATDPRQGARWMIERAAAARRAALDSLFVGDQHVSPTPYYQNTPIRDEPGMRFEHANDPPRHRSRGQRFGLERDRGIVHVRRIDFRDCRRVTRLCWSNREFPQVHWATIAPLLSDW